MDAYMIVRIINWHTAIQDIFYEILLSVDQMCDIMDSHICCVLEKVCILLSYTYILKAAFIISDTLIL